MREAPAANHACLVWDGDSERWSGKGVADTPFEVTTCSAAGFKAINHRILADRVGK
jgi:hypothetical protein